MSYNEQLRCDYLTTNHEGAIAWRMSPEWELYSTVVTTMGVEDKFYESGEDRVRHIADLVRKVKPEFVAQLAVYTREQMHLRSVPLLLLVELDQCHQGDSLVSRAVCRTVQRADEITELLMCYQWRLGRKDLKGLSNQLRKGLAEAFNNFDEYQFAKYNRKNHEVTLRDALMLVKPKPKDDAQADIFRKIQSDTLETPYTWETELSAVGQQHFESAEEKNEAKREVWRQLARSHRMGYMATLRNLRNMLFLGVDDDTMRMVCNFIANPDAVRRSKQLPFRFLSAYLELIDGKKASVDMSRYYQFKSELNQQRMEIREIEESVDKMRQGYFLTNIRVVKRFHDKLSASSVINLTHVPTELGYRPIMKHRRVIVKGWKRYVNPSEKNLMLLEMQERRLPKLMQRKEQLEFLLAQEYNLILKEEMRIKEEEEKRIQFLNSDICATVLQSLEKAASCAAENIPGFDEQTRVLLASDVSGSMCNAVSQNSSVMCFHIGILLSMLMKYRCPQAVTGMFGNIWKAYETPSRNVLQNTVDMLKCEGEVGYSTNGHKVIDRLIERKRVMDKVMFFTDCQLWDSQWGNTESLAKSWDRYKQIAPDARLYLFDLAGYGQSPISMERDDVFSIAGWSDKVFDILQALEHGNSAIDEIRRIVV